MGKNLYQEIVSGERTRPARRIGLFRVIRWLLLLYILYFLAGALIPFARQPEAGPASLPAALSDGACTDRAILVLDNQDALDLRLQMIAGARESILLTSFDIRDSESARDIFAALLAASERGVTVQILWDGLSGMLHGSAPAFLALGSRDNVEIRFYNRPNFLLPWTFNGRMHDKYLIADHQRMVLGGRNTFDLFLGDYVPDEDKSHDVDVLVCTTADTLDHSVIGQVEGYFTRIWDQTETRTALDRVPFWKAGAVAQAEDMLRGRAAYALQALPLDYAALTYAVEGSALLHNPTTILAKEPTLWAQLQTLMDSAEERVYLQTPYAVLNRVMYDRLAQVSAPIELQLNSVAVGDNFVASSDYLTNRDHVLETGITLWEWFGDYSSHGKTALIDDLALVGSYNWDLRSTYVDTELMLVLDSPGLLEQLEGYLQTMEAHCLRVLPEGNYLPRSGVEELPYQDPKHWLYPLTRWLTQPFRFLI